MLFQNFKISENILEALQEQNLTEATEIQSLAFSKIMSGQGLVISAPEGSGKTTLLTLALINKLKQPQLHAPRAIVIVSSKDKIQEMETIFRQLAFQTELRVLGMNPKEPLDEQRERLAEGADIVITTADKILELHIRSAINLTQLKHFVIEDAEVLIKEKKQVNIKNLHESLKKCQYIITTNEITEKTEVLADTVMPNPIFIDIEEYE